jgi:hypothetical protein
MRRSGFSPDFLACCGLLAWLAGCAHYVVPVATVEPAPLTGRLTSGVVVSVRSINATQDTALTHSILIALGQSQVNIPALPAEEVVILRADQTATSIVEPAHSGPTGYAAGEKIAIVEAAATMIHPE